MELGLNMLIYIILLVLAGVYILFMSMRHIIDSGKIVLFLPFFILAMGFFGIVPFLIDGKLNKIFLDVSVFLTLLFLTLVIGRRAGRKCM